MLFKHKVIGHRGASAYAPENTMVSFVKAAQMDIQWVEFDVMQALCGEPVIFHDEKLDRTTNASGRVNQYPYSLLRTLDAGSWFDPKFASERIPNLRSVLLFLTDTQLCANVEIKALPGEEEKIVKRVLNEMRPYLKKANNNFLFSSFSIEALHILRHYAPDINLGILIHEWEQNWESLCRSLNCATVHVNHKIMSPEAAEQIKAMNKYLLCYTVNDRRRARELFSYGVDAVFSDFPDVVMI